MNGTLVPATMGKNQISAKSVSSRTDGTLTNAGD
jgi:hypothetical protein